MNSELGHEGKCAYTESLLLERQLDASIGMQAYFARIFFGLAWGSQTCLKWDSALAKSTFWLDKLHFAK